MEIDKSQIIELLKSRGEDAKAQQAEGELPDKVDTEKDSGLLEKYGLNAQDVVGRCQGDWAASESILIWAGRRAIRGKDRSLRLPPRLPACAHLRAADLSRTRNGCNGPQSRAGPLPSDAPASRLGCTRGEDESGAVPSPRRPARSQDRRGAPPIQRAARRSSAASCCAWGRGEQKNSRAARKKRAPAPRDGGCTATRWRSTNYAARPAPRARRRPPFKPPDDRWGVPGEAHGETTCSEAKMRSRVEPHVERPPRARMSPKRPARRWPRVRRPAPRPAPRPGRMKSTLVLEWDMAQAEIETEAVSPAPHQPPPRPVPCDDGTP